jgi:hypothetical protein
LYRQYTDRTLTAIARESRRPKISATNLGFIAATGHATLEEGVLDRISQQPPATLGELFGYIAAERQAATRWPESELKTHALKATGWILSHETMTSAGDRAVHVEIFHPSFGDDTYATLTPGRTYAFARDEFVGRHLGWLGDSVRVCAADEDDDAAIDASIEHNVNLLRTLIHQYANEPEPKSTAECTIALHAPGGCLLLTDVLAPGEPLIWNAADADEDLIKVA